jgi:hypothetical protein
MYLETHPHTDINPAPHHTKRFHVEDMRRIPVTISDEAKNIIDRSSYQGRVFTQGLSEFFGTLPDVEQVEIGTERDGDLLSIHVKHAEDEDKHHRFLIRAERLHQVSEQPGKGFEAATTANELLRLYRTHVLKEGEVWE